MAKTVVKHGKFAGTVGSLENKDTLVDMGYKFISIGADVVAMSQYYNNIASSFKGSVKGCSSSIYNK